MARIKGSANLYRQLKKANSITDKAIVSALNKSTKTVKTRVVRGVSRETRVKQKILKKRMFVRLAHIKNKTASFRVYRRDITAASILGKKKLLKHVGAGTNKKGVRVAGQQINSAFVARLTTRHDAIHVMTRISHRRYPIDVVRIPITKSVDRISEKVTTQVMKDKFPGLLAHELQFRFTKLTDKG